MRKFHFLFALWASRRGFAYFKNIRFYPQGASVKELTGQLYLDGTGIESR
jgi:hypothetical protein